MKKPEEGAGLEAEEHQGGVSEPRREVESGGGGGNESKPNYRLEKSGRRAEK